MTSRHIPLFVATCLSVACGTTTHDEAATPDAGKPPPLACDMVGQWGPVAEVMPSVTVPGDGFYSLFRNHESEAYDVERYDPVGGSSIVATLPAPAGTVTRLFARGAALHYARDTDWEIRHGAIGGPEQVIATDGRRVVDVQAADLGGLFVAFRDLALDEYFYTIYDAEHERFTQGFTSMSSVHPRPGAPPVIARITDDGRLIAGVAGQPMLELPSSCTAKRPYSVVALSDGGIAWAHACSTEGSSVGMRTATGEVAHEIFDEHAESVSLAEGPDRTIVLALVGWLGQLSLHVFDGHLKELASEQSSAVHVEGDYQFPLSAVSLSRMTIGPVFAIAGKFEIPDGYIEKLALGTLCP